MMLRVFALYVHALTPWKADVRSALKASAGPARLVDPLRPPTVSSYFVSRQDRYCFQSYVRRSVGVVFISDEMMNRLWGLLTFTSFDHRKGDNADKREELVPMQVVALHSPICSDEFRFLCRRCSIICCTRLLCAYMWRNLDVNSLRAFWFCLICPCPEAFSWSY
jgi:hypothetical protein